MLCRAGKRVSLLLPQHIIRHLSTPVQPSQPTQPSFWPPGPPPFSKDPKITATADSIYSALFKHYRQLGRMSPAEIKDPWARREEWRYHPYFGPINVFKHAFPGFTWALAAFTVYCGYEKFVLEPNSTSDVDHH